jgi:hypothetical protein
MADIVVKGRQAQLFRVSHFNPAGIALTSFFTTVGNQISTLENHKGIFGNRYFRKS